jgi:hypothetical protein
VIVPLGMLDLRQHATRLGAAISDWLPRTPMVCRLGKADLRLYATRLGATGLGPCLQSQTKGSALMLQLPMALMLRRHRRKPTLVCRLSRGNSSLKTDRDWWSWPSTSLLV